MSTEKVGTREKIRNHILEQTGEEHINWRTMGMYIHFLLFDVKPAKACSPYEFCVRYYDKLSPVHREKMIGKYYRLHLFLKNNSITSSTTWEEVENAN